MHFKNDLRKIIIKTMESLFSFEEKIDFTVEYPPNDKFGDYSSNIALQASRFLKKQPREIASQLAEKGHWPNWIVKVTVAGPGFLNFFLSDKFLINSLHDVLNWQKEKLDLGKESKIMVEYAHPNTHKPFHIGHLRNIITGEAMVRLFEVGGYKVIRANYQGDVGLHIAKCLWGLNRLEQQGIYLISEVEKESASKKAMVLGKAYVLGSEAYKKDEESRLEIVKINQQIYEKEPPIVDLWRKTRKWSLDYFTDIYEKVYSHFDRFYFESEVAEKGKKLVLDGLRKGVFQKSEGAIIFDGEKYGLHKRVFINQKGFPTYEAKDMELGRLQFAEYDPDFIIHVVAPEQEDYFKVIFKVLAQLFPETEGKEYHLKYGWVKLKKGKMSSRKGNVVLGNWLIDEAKKEILKILSKNRDYDKEEKERIAEVVAIGAIKYSFLKVKPLQDIAFDFEESISFQGKSGPYIQYAYARAQGILAKAPQNLSGGELKGLNLEEKQLIKLLIRFEEILTETVIDYSPQILAEYLFQLAQSFNNFYHQVPVLKANKNEINFRLTVCQASALILKKGLNFLGIKVLEKM